MEKSWKQLLLAFSLFLVPSEGYSLVNTASTAITVVEDTQFNLPGVELDSDFSSDFSVKLSVRYGSLEINFPQDPPGENPSIEPELDNKTVRLKGKREAINAALEELSYKPDRNFRGNDELNIEIIDDSGTLKESKIISIRVNPDSNEGRCINYAKETNEGKHLGDLASRLSVGSVVNYSVVRYNLADKKSSFNSQAFGFGVAFRYYTPSQLGQAKTNSIKNVPLACRAKTTDLLNFSQAPDGELPKIGALFSFSPTFYVFKDKNENDLGTQLAMNFGFLNDFITVGVGWNLSGGDAGEWFVLAGPSVGFQF